MLDWLLDLIPLAEEYQFIAILAAAALVIAFSCIALSVFCGIFAAIFRR